MRSTTSTVFGDVDQRRSKNHFRRRELRTVFFEFVVDLLNQAPAVAAFANVVQFPRFQRLGHPLLVLVVQPDQLVFQVSQLVLPV